MAHSQKTNVLTRKRKRAKKKDRESFSSSDRGSVAIVVSAPSEGDFLLEMARGMLVSRQYSGKDKKKNSPSPTDVGTAPNTEGAEGKSKAANVSQAGLCESGLDVAARCRHVKGCCAIEGQGRRFVRR